MFSKLSGDQTFASIVAILVVAGLAIFASASLGLLARAGQSLLHVAADQILLGLIPGIAALIFIRFMPTKWLMKSVFPFYIVTILLTLAVFVPGLGHHTNGATRWIQLGPMTVQPAEFLKLSVILMFAGYLAEAKNKIFELRYGLAMFAAIVGIPIIILIAQPNNSTVLIIGTTTLAMYFLAGAPWRDFAIIAAVAIIGLLMVYFTHSYIRQRVETFLHPSNGSTTSGYQIQQSLIAIGSGRFLGRGYGQSVQKFNYLPEPNSDSIFAVFGEEFGFLGTTLLVILYMAFATRGLMLAGEASTTFGSLAVTGLTLLVTLSAFMNIGAMLGVLPLTGVPLPFISQGGTALLAALASVGIILHIASHRTRKKAKLA